MSSTDGTTPSSPRHDGDGPDGQGSVVVTRAAGPGPAVSAVAWVAIIGLVVVIAGAAAVFLSGPLFDRAVVGGPVSPTATLNATAAPSTDAVPAGAAPAGEASAAPPSVPEDDLQPVAVPGATRLSLLGPQMLLDTRGSVPLPPGGEATVALPDLPPGTTAVLAEVSLLSAAGPGVVTVASGDVTVPVLRLPGAGAQTSATVTVPVAADGDLTVRTEGGGDLTLTLVGAYEPALSTAAGRVVTVPATRVLDLVPETDGNIATVDLTAVPALADAHMGAVMLHVSADVGDRGGSVAAGASPDDLRQEVVWTATSDDDRVRVGFLVVPVGGEGSVTVEYQAGREMNVDVVGYVTSETAPDSADGLVVPVAAPAALDPVAVPPQDGAAVTVVSGGEAIAPDRVTGVLVGTVGEGVVEGGVSVHSPADPPPADPTLSVTPAGPRAVLALSGVVDGAVRLTSDGGADVTLTPQALVVSAG